MNVGLNYVATLFRRGDELPEVRSLLAQTTSAGGHPDRAAALVPIEGDRWIIGLGSYADDRPTQDREDFLLRCQQILAPPLRAVVEHCDVLQEPATFHQADSRRRDFHRLDRFPAGLLVVGDALACFNPIYGQGMTSAALHASCLSTYLRSMASVREPAWDYFRRACVVVDAAWQSSTFADLALPHVPGPYPRGYRIAQRLSDLIVRASVTDVEINRRFLDVLHMRAHPNTLVRPGTLLRATRVVRSQAVPAIPS
jgi:2-polyprenyl-6-methoxyphenol hydroxylase-like FAD-dependent oxidoreductase